MIGRLDYKTNLMNVRFILLFVGHYSPFTKVIVSILSFKITEL